MTIRSLRGVRRRSYRVPYALCVAGLLAGCSSSHELASGEEAELDLAALMKDGKLPPDMEPDPMLPPPSPRFCGEGGGGFGPGPGMGVAGSSADEPGPSDAGVAGEDAGSGSGSGGMGGQSDGGVGDGGFGDGGVGEVEDCTRVPIGFWRFDDCNFDRTDLQDSSFQGHPAFRNIQQSCSESQEGLGAVFARRTDLVYAPDQPDFGLAEGVTIAAWVKPDRIDGVRTLFRKRDKESSAFALLIHARKYQFVLQLESGQLVSVSAPAVQGQWTHVAATYDLYTLRLYLDGEEVAYTDAPGVISKGPGPLLMGNDASERRLEGMLDNAWFNTLAASPDKIMELTCLRRPASLSVEPEVGPAVPAGTEVEYLLSVTSNDTASCPEESFITFVNVPNEFSTNPFFQFTPPAVPGETVTVPFLIASGEETEPDSYPIDFNLFSFDFGVQQSVQATYVVEEPTGCHVTSGRELTIRHVSVVDDPVRTSMNGDPMDPRTGAWAFGRMMERLSPTPSAAPDVTEQMFGTFALEPVVNGFAIPSRPSIDPVVLEPWPRLPNGDLDLAAAPLRLLAIVNRLDLKNLDAGKAGEGRIVYGVLDEEGFPMEFTVILEYLLPADDETEYLAWVESFHALQALPFPSEEYNAALQAITDRFTGRDAGPGLPNGSLLIDIRTNEIALGDPGQLREFHISPVTGFMDPAGLFQTPDGDFNFGERLGRFINENEAAILAETHEVPPDFEDEPFQGSFIFNNIDIWSAPDIANPEARHKFSLNTCNGCHGGETNTEFLHIFPRFEGEQSSLSGFLTGTTVFDPETDQERRLAELRRRRELLEEIVCADPDAP